MTTKDEALQMALEALEQNSIGDAVPSAINAIKMCREALAQKDEKEPVAWKRRLVEIHDALSYELGDTDPHIEDDMTDEEVREEMPVFWAAKEVATLIGDAPWDSPPLHHPKLQPLTDEQIEKIWDSTLSEDVGITALRKITRAIEAAHSIGEEYEPR